MQLSIEPLHKAFLSLVKALARASIDPSDLELRDACIQRFEYTYELSIKLIKRYIEFAMPLPENVDQLNYRDLLRIAFELGLIDPVERWFEYREARNQTSHAYDESKAKLVYAILPDFVVKVQFLLSQLEERLIP